MFESSESENEDEDEIIGKVRTVYNTEQASNHYTDQTILSKLESRVKRIKYDNSEIIKKKTPIFMIIFKFLEQRGLEQTVEKIQ